MTEWSLSVLLAGLHDDIQQKLETVRKCFGHTTTKGDASEKVWLELLQTYLPQRYQAAKAHVVDSERCVQRTDRCRDLRPAIFAVHLSISGPDDHPGRKRLRRVRGQAEHQRRSCRLRAEESRQRAMPASNQLADPVCTRHLSTKAADPDPRRHPNLRERLEPSVRSSPSAMP